MNPISFHRELFVLSTNCFWIVNMAPIATLSCKESFTISHYLNRFVSIHTQRPLKGKIRNLNCIFFHFLHIGSPLLSNTANKRVYGECNNLAVHSHEYTVEVITRGTVDTSIGTVMSLSHLKSLLKSTVANKLHGKNLDYEINFFRTVVSTFCFCLSFLAVKSWLTHDEIDRCKTWIMFYSIHKFNSLVVENFYI